MIMTFQLPQNTIFYQLEKSIKLYRKMAQQKIDAHGFGISLNQLILLIQLSKRPESSQVELADFVFKDFASVARMVDLLVKKGYLTRTENKIDRRKKDLTPTAACRNMIQVLLPVITEYRQLALQGFDEKELELLSRLLGKLSSNCEESLMINTP